jgi:hypothetical protein
MVTKPKTAPKAAPVKKVPALDLIFKILQQIKGTEQPIWRVIDMDAGEERLFNLEDIISFYGDFSESETMDLIAQLMSTPVNTNVTISTGWIVKRQPWG